MNKILNFLKKFVGNKEFYKEMFAISLPIALQQFVSAIVNLLDGLMVAGYGQTDATSGVAIATKYYSSFNMIMFMFAISCSVFIAQFYGAKKYAEIKKSFGVSVILTMIFGIVSMFAGVIFRDQIIELFTGGEGVNAREYQFGLDYLQIVVVSFIPQSLTVSFTAAFRSIKQTKVPFYSSVAAAVTNTLLNLILINGYLGMPVLGVQGAAIATVIARLVELSILAFTFFKYKPCFYGSFQEVFAFDKDVFKGIIKKSWPIVLAQTLTEIMGVFMLFVYANLEKGNSGNVAAVTISQQIQDIVVVFVGGLGSAATVLVGSRLGADKIDEAKQNAKYQLSYAITFSIFSAIIMILGRPLVAWAYHFNEADTQLLNVVMLLQALSFPFLIFAINVIFITRAGGYTKAPIFITNLVYYGVKLPIIILIVYIFPGFYDSFVIPLSSSIGIIPSYVVFIFFVDRFMEVIRSIVATIIYKTVPWYKNITRIRKEEIKVEA